MKGIDRIKYIFPLTVLIVCLVMYFKIFIFDNNEIDTQSLTTDFVMSSHDLVSFYSNGEDVLNNEIVEKTVEVYGMVDHTSFKNDKLTVFLKSDTGDSFVICEMKSDQSKKICQLKKGQEVLIKGVVKGYLMDVILLNGIILKPKFSIK